MIKVNYQGRFGNNLFQYSVACLLSRKFSQRIQNHLNTRIVNIKEYDNKIFTNTLEINDENFREVFERDEVKSNFIVNGYFQTEYVVSLFETNRDLFENMPKIQIHPFNFVHVRLGDLLNYKEIVENMPQFNYYSDCLEGSKGGYISSDTPEHPIVKRLIKDHDLKFYQNSPENTIIYASSFANKVLSLGTFSWWIGFLGNLNVITFHSVKYPNLNKYKNWHGDIFSSMGWMAIK